jgi:lipopolysaccharide/colanic/teichoic acid biosynthesis glycosyltransferase
MTLPKEFIKQPNRKFSNIKFNYEKINIWFFYIGSDKNMIEYFYEYFECGYIKDNLIDAAKFIHKLYLKNNKLPEVVFVDVPFKEKELGQFCTDLKNNMLLANLPVIYNEKQLKEPQINKLRQLQLVDDISIINSSEINYFSKILFLKQCKLYNQLFAAPKMKQIPKKKFKKLFFYLVKRSIDVSISTLGILMLSPILLVVAFAIRLESKGSILYTSLRAGKGFKIFKFYKFRSMIANADKEVESLSKLNQYDTKADGPKFFKINNDPRITKLGKILRNTSADELPQLFNVLKGDMSLVGNRPLPIYEAVTLTTNEFVERFSAPAGITGLWQVNKRGKSDMSSEERINLDITYSRNCNVLYDLKIMAKTPVALFQKSSV